MQLLKEEYFTYADYITWNDDARYELIEGVPHAMSPAPSWIHQSISGELCRQFANFLKGKPCKAFAAPFDVRLNADDADDTVVQPDITILCDRSKLDAKGGGCNGVPDMVVEIISPSTSRHDRITKFKLNQESGVREYWVVYPEHKAVDVHIVENGKYATNYYGDDDMVPVTVLEGCYIHLTDVFAE